MALKTFYDLLRGKKIVLGISGSIAAYKIPYLLRILINSRAEVKVLMTCSAKHFVTKATLATLSKVPVWDSFRDNNQNWNNYVELGIWADALLIAPATANTIAKMTLGGCDNIVLATYLSARCSVFFAPAMDLDMYQHPAIQENIARLQNRGNILIPAEKGWLASGLSGQGRMAEPDHIAAILAGFFKEKASYLSGKKVLITLGPTYEAIDPVRFMGNKSSGKMGFALARAALELGAQVTLICGPVKTDFEEKNVKKIAVTSAKEMLYQTSKYFDECDVLIMSAAVSDYRAKTIVKEKIKKNQNDLLLHLTLNPDILKILGSQKKHQYIVGFALETENELENAQKKLKEKKLDLIVLNSLKDAGAGFETDTNKVTLINSKQEVIPLSLKSKKNLAFDIWNHIWHALS